MKEQSVVLCAALFLPVVPRNQRRDRKGGTEKGGTLQIVSISIYRFLNPYAFLQKASG